jgi:hypothetical protein
MKEYSRMPLLAGPLAVVLWIAGIFCITHDQPGDHATGAHILSWYRADSNWVLVGGWLFMLGCIAFVWFGSALRTRLVDAGSGQRSLATLAFAGIVGAAVSGLLIPAADIAGALNKNDIDGSTAATFHRLSDAFFVTTELAVIVPVAAISLLAWRTRVLPRWWAALGGLVAVVLAIGPIGWAALIFGLPIWTLGTAAILLWAPAARRASVATA